jgi:hypothetical protein
MRATRTHLSQVFGLYRDPDGVTVPALASVNATTPALDSTTGDGCRHLLWPVTDAATIAALVRGLAGRQVMIADGHHRYETMLALRDEVRPAGLPAGAAAADWGSVFLARAEDPGLLVLPTHRLIRNLAGFDLDALRVAASKIFDVTIGDEITAPAIEKRLVAEGRRRVTFADLDDLAELAVDVFHLEHLVVGHFGLGQQHVHVARHAAGHRVDGVLDVDATLLEQLGQVADGVLGLGHRHTVARDHDHGPGVVEQDREAGERISYRDRGANWFVISGTKGGNEFYERYLLSHGGKIVNGFVMTYPARLRTAYDPIVTRMSRSFRAGRGADTEGNP